MTDLIDFLPLIRLDAPECPDAILEHQLRNAAIEFCQESLCWHQAMTPISTTAGQRDYTVAAPANTVVLLCYQLELDGSKVEPVFTARNALTLSNDPLAGQSLTGRIALAPTRSATQVPDELYDLYLDALVGGALARLFAQPNRPWSAPHLVAYQRELFEQGYLDAKVRVLKQYDGADLALTSNPTTFGVS